MVEFDGVVWLVGAVDSVGVVKLIVTGLVGSLDFVGCSVVKFGSVLKWCAT